MQCVAILNCEGGTLKTMDVDALSDDIRKVFETAGHDLDPRIVTGEDLEAELAAAANTDGVDAVLIAGGDGSVSAAAAALWRTDKALGVLPAGTMNLFARSLDIPLDLEQAMVALADGRVRACDIATANGRPFVHHFSVGLHPRMLRTRDKYNFGSRFGKVWASIRAMSGIVSEPPRFIAHIRADARDIEPHPISAVTISNNMFSEGHLPYADAVDEGCLAVYIAEALTSTEAAHLASDLFLGHWCDNEQLDIMRAQKVALEFPNRKSSDVASIDGELIPLERDVVLEMHPGCLNALVPQRIETA